MKVVRLANIYYPIYVAIFDNEYQKGLTFVRLQEFWESSSPQFRNSFFTLEEYMEWYAKQFKYFSYPTDWAGFNVPGNAVDAFWEIFHYRYDMNHLEKELFNKLELARERYEKQWLEKTEKYYLIGALWNDTKTIQHELYHALFYHNKRYRSDILKLTKKYQCRQLRKQLIEEGYHPNRLDDEIHAYALAGWTRWQKSPTQEMLTLKEKLCILAKRYEIPEVKLDMRVVIAGSRSCTDPALIEQAVQESGFSVSEVVSGTARGADSLGEEWAEQHKIPIKRFPADWRFYGKKAGPIRNESMAKYADAVIVVWDGKSPGSKNMIEAAKRNGCMLHVKTYG